jgi:predicted RNA-binding protein
MGSTTSIQASSNRALKEWAAIVEAIGQGKQAILLRKYAPARREFFLYPTYEFARPKDYLERFQPQYRDFVKEVVSSKSKKVTDISYYASVDYVYHIEKADLPSLGDMARLYIWTPEHVAGYFVDSDEAFVWLLKVYRLSEPMRIPDLGRGAITYANLRQPISTQGAIPVITDQALHDIKEQIQASISAIRAKIEVPEKKVIEQPEISHNQLRDMIRDIGLRENRIAETEYPIDGYRLDAIWKRIKGGTPSHVFEVQIGGNLEQALTKLKHAWDKWNSIPYLVTTDEDAAKARSLLEGSFHEMGHVARVIDWKDIAKLYELLNQAYQLRSRIGL